MISWIGHLGKLEFKLWEEFQGSFELDFFAMKLNLILVFDNCLKAGCAVIKEYFSAVINLGSVSIVHV